MPGTSHEKDLSSSQGSSEPADTETPSLDLFGSKTPYNTFLTKLQEKPLLYAQYQCLSEKLQKEFLDFCTGNAGLPITYDPFFKYIFDPAVAPERLSAFLSCILNEKVIVKQALPVEGGRLVEEGSLLIMDIIVSLTDGSLANIEIQKIAYRFPGERIACYNADLLLRQYSRCRSEKGKSFSYKDLKRVYTIVIYEFNNEIFTQYPNTYIHRGEFTYDSGLTLNLLSKNIIIALDIFQKNTLTIATELDAWLFFLCSDKPERIWEIQEKFPFFKSLYHDIFQFRKQIEEVLNMFSEELRIMDRNTTILMIDEFREKAERAEREIEQRAELLAEQLAEQKAEHMAKQMAKQMAEQMAKQMAEQMAEQMVEQKVTAAEQQLKQEMEYLRKQVAELKAALAKNN